MEYISLSTMRDIFTILENLGISYKHFPFTNQPFPTDDLFWKERGLTRCKSIFLRNHRGTRHFLVILDYYKNLDINLLEKKFGQGKISFASPGRLKKWLNLDAGCVSPFGLVNDSGNHVEVYIDMGLEQRMLTFPPNCRGSLVKLDFNGIIKFLGYTGNQYEILQLVSD